MGLSVQSSVGPTQALAEQPKTAGIEEGASQAGSGRGEVGGHASTLTIIKSVISGAVEQLRAAQRGRGDREGVLAGALAKLETAGRVLSGAGGGLSDALAELMRLQGTETNQRSQLARGQIADKFRKLQEQIKKELEQIRKRVEAAKKSGFWGAIIKVLKVVATAVATVAAVASGNPLLMVGVALSIASLVTAMVSDSELAKSLSVGLGVAGALLSAGAGFGANPDIPLLSKVAGALGDKAGGALQMATGVGAAAANGLAAAAMVPRAMADGEAMDAQAGLLELRAWGKRLNKEIEDERDLIATLFEAYQRGLAEVVRILGGQERGTAAAAEEGAIA